MTRSHAQFGAILTVAMAAAPLETLGHGADWDRDFEIDWRLQSKSPELITATEPDHPIRSGITVTDIDGVPRNNSRINGSTGVNDVSTTGGEYRGGRSEANPR